MTHVVTLTPAPALDRAYQLETIRLGKVNRVQSVHTFLSGKGINVARALNTAQLSVHAVLPIGQDDAHHIARDAAYELMRGVPVVGGLRVNTAVTDQHGVTTNFNERARALTASDWAALTAETLERVAESRAEWLVVSGQFPRLAEDDEPLDLAPLFQQARALGALIAVDTSGPEMVRWARSGLVDLIKPNRDELEECIARSVSTVGEAIEAARELIATGLRYALVTLGGDGSLIVTADEAWHAVARPGRVANTTGAGDAALAGFISSTLPRVLDGGAERSLPRVDILAGVATASSWGALAVSQPTTALNSLEGAPASTTAKPDPGQLLGGDED